MSRQPSSLSSQKQNLLTLRWDASVLPAILVLRRKWKTVSIYRVNEQTIDESSQYKKFGASFQRRQRDLPRAVTAFQLRLFPIRGCDWYTCTYETWRERLIKQVLLPFICSNKPLLSAVPAYGIDEDASRALGVQNRSHPKQQRQAEPEIGVVNSVNNI